MGVPRTRSGPASRVSKLECTSPSRLRAKRLLPAFMLFPAGIGIGVVEHRGRPMRNSSGALNGSQHIVFWTCVHASRPRGPPHALCATPPRVPDAGAAPQRLLPPHIKQRLFCRCHSMRLRQHDDRLTGGAALVGRPSGAHAQNQTTSPSPLRTASAASVDGRAIYTSSATRHLAHHIHGKTPEATYDAQQIR